MHRRQSGAVLFISMVLMSALSILGLTAMRNALREEKIAQSAQDMNLASEAAESALRQGQYRLRDHEIGSTDSGLSKSWLPGARAPDLSTPEWESDRPYHLSVTDMAFNSDTLDARTTPLRPKYWVEEVGVETKDLGRGHLNIEFTRPLNIRYYRIIARGLGLSGKNEILLETMLIESSH
jgi:type IV pilus assembly protein PilX